MVAIIILHNFKKYVQVICIFCIFELQLLLKTVKIYFKLLLSIFSSAYGEKQKKNISVKRKLLSDVCTMFSIKAVRDQNL